MSTREPLALRIWADRPWAWGLAAVANAIGAVVTLLLGYGFAVLLFLLGVAVTAARSYQLLTPGNAGETGDVLEEQGDPEVEREAPESDEQ